MRRAIGLLLFLSAASALADVAPPMPKTDEQIRRDRGLDDCRQRQDGDRCTDMKGNAGKCGWFTWWWIPGSNERASEGASISFAAYVTRCEQTTRTVKAKNGGDEKTAAFNCLVCK